MQSQFLSSSLAMMMRFWLFLLLLLCPSVIVLFTDAVASSQQLPSKTSLQVVYCGMGRMGTHSLSAALDRLGYRSFHGSELFRRFLDPKIKTLKHLLLHADQIPNGMELLVQETEALGINATMEMHAFHCPQLIQYKKPSKKTKYIFLIRDHDSWSNSLSHLTNAIVPFFRPPMAWIQPFKEVHETFLHINRLGLRFEELYQDDNNKDLYEEKEIMELAQHVLRYPFSKTTKSLYRRIYDIYLREAMEVTTKRYPKHSILLTMGSFGYEELCTFLEIHPDKCPLDEPFPHVGSKWDIRIRLLFTHLQEKIIILFPLAFFGILIFLALKSLGIINAEPEESGGNHNNEKEKGGETANVKKEQ